MPIFKRKWHGQARDSQGQVTCKFASRARLSTFLTWSSEIGKFTAKICSPFRAANSFIETSSTTSLGSISIGWKFTACTTSKCCRDVPLPRGNPMPLQTARQTAENTLAEEVKHATLYECSSMLLASKNLKQEDGMLFVLPKASERVMISPPKAWAMRQHILKLLAQNTAHASLLVQCMGVCNNSLTENHAIAAVHIWTASLKMYPIHPCSRVISVPLTSQTLTQYDGQQGTRNNAWIVSRHSRKDDSRTWLLTSSSRQVSTVRWLNMLGVMNSPFKVKLPESPIFKLLRFLQRATSWTSSFAAQAIASYSCF